MSASRYAGPWGGRWPGVWAGGVAPAGASASLAAYGAGTAAAKARRTLRAALPVLGTGVAAWRAASGLRASLSVSVHSSAILWPDVRQGQPPAVEGDHWDAIPYGGPGSQISASDFVRLHAAPARKRRLERELLLIARGAL